jgi:hypothetical protein
MMLDIRYCILDTDAAGIFGGRVGFWAFFNDIRAF